METKTIRIEQTRAKPEEVDKVINAEIKALESNGKKILDVKLAVGRDAGIDAEVSKRYSVTIILLYE